MKSKKTRFYLTTLVTVVLGAVMLDAGTSPNYTYAEILKILRDHGDAHPDPVGLTSLVVWTLLIVVGFYSIIMMRANHEGDGGALAYRFIVQLSKASPRLKAVTMTLGIFAVGLMFADTSITNSITATSAWEGVISFQPTLQPYKLYLVAGFILFLFSIQFKGLNFVGSLIAPVGILWYSVISYFGGKWVWLHPEILAALNPLQGLAFAYHHGQILAKIMSGVLLVVTGVEAITMDQKAYGQKAIRLAVCVALPLLILNYLGQGARLLDGAALISPEGQANPFWSLATNQVELGVLVLSALLAGWFAGQAVIIASSALITAAISQGLFPRMEIRHTSEEDKGHVYIPLLTRGMCILAIGIVLVLRDSLAIGGAYGMCVAATLIISVVAVSVIARYVWGWGKLLVLAVFGPFSAVVALLFWGSLTKFAEGGWWSMTLAVFLSATMLVWVWGRNKTRQAYQTFAEPVSIARLVDLYKRVWSSPRGVLEDKHGRFVGTDRAVLVLAPSMVDDLSSLEPPSLRSYLRQNGTMPAYIMFLTINEAPVPYIEGERYRKVTLLEGKILSVAVLKGFMEDLPMLKILEDLDSLGVLPASKEGWEAIVGDEVITVTKECSYVTRKLATAYGFLRRLALPAYTYFGVTGTVSRYVAAVPILVSPDGACVHRPDPQVVIKQTVCVD